jgi:hypothetical protein
MKTNMKVALTAVAALLVAAPAFAFHDGGVAQCEGCHTMHNSLGGAVMTTFLPQYQSGPFLLKAEDQSGACLNCHQKSTDTGPSSYHVSTIDTAINTAGITAADFPKQRGPGGDFRWLKVVGDRAGHNIIAKNFNYTKDNSAGYTKAPGGEYPVANLHCSSCHDPHAKYRYLSDGTVATTGAPIVGSASYTNVLPVAGEALGVYRFVGGLGYLPKSLSANPTVAFAKTEVPNAVAPSTYNATEASAQVIVAYGKNMSEWCANCHGTIHANNMQPGDYLAGTGNLTHPASNTAKLSFIADNYNAYKSSGIMTGGTYSSLVPFEQGKGQFDSALVAGAAPTASTTDSNVACISCHRVHASGYASMLRFDINMFTQDSAGVVLYSGSASTQAKAQAALYDRAPAQFGADARTLCNKCHAKD